jgi:hypothetical protein
MKIQLKEKVSGVKLVFEEARITLETDNKCLEMLKKLEDSIDFLVIKTLDLNNSSYQNQIETYSSYLTYTNDKLPASHSSRQINFIEVYRILYSMFDIGLNCIVNNKTTGKLEVVNQLNDKSLETILVFYDFVHLLDLNRIKQEYKIFFEHFFASFTQEEKDFILNLKKSDKSQFTLLNLNFNSVNFVDKFLKYVHVNNDKKFVPIVSFMAANYLTLPCMINLTDTTNDNQTAIKSMNEFEQKMKWFSFIQSPLTYELEKCCGVDLAKVNYIDIFE